MFRSMLRKLSRSLTSNSTRPSCPISCRTTLAIEGLEDRLVPASLYISAAANQSIYIQALGNGQAAVTNEQTGASFLYTIESVNSVNINLQGSHDNIVYIDDSKGMPFFPHTTIDVSGSGTLVLEGGRTVTGDELYQAGEAASDQGVIQMDNLNFTIEPGIHSVLDSIPITGNFNISTSSPGVTLNNIQEPTGLGNGGGGSLYFNNKPNVALTDFASNASVFVDAIAEPGEQTLRIDMAGASDTTTLDMTPNNVQTTVRTFQDGDFVNVWGNGNAAPVTIDGFGHSTDVSVGYPLGNGLFTTSGIQANVTVNGVSSMVVSDNGNDTTNESVKVTNSSISGSGLFGNVVTSLFYNNITGPVTIFTGQLTDTYTVIGSQRGATFPSQINIADDSKVSFQANVTVDSGSHLNLHMFNESAQFDNGTELLGVINLHHGTRRVVEQNNSAGNGFAKVLFGGGDESEVFVQGYVVRLKR